MRALLIRMRALQSRERYEFGVSVEEVCELLVRAAMAAGVATELCSPD